MFESISRSIDIVKKSFGVLMDEKKLLLLPLVSTIVLVGVFISFILPTFLVSGSSVLTYALVAVFYLVSYFIIIFFNSALVHAIGNKIDSKPVSLVESISFAFSRIVQILEWSVIAATVGLILSFLRGQAQNQRGIGGLIAGLVVSAIGMAWSLATFFVVPLIVFEGTGPLEALKRSVELIKKTWGEEIVGGLGISLLFFVLYLLGIGAILLFVFLGVFPLIIVVIPYFLAVFLVQSTIQSIFMTVLYRYANSGQQAVYAPETFDNAFKSKQPPAV